MEDKSKHVYYTADGKEVPSVTHIISIISKRELMKWANFLGFKRIDVTRYVSEKALIGTLFHNRVECVLQGRENDYKPYIDQNVNDEVDKIFHNFEIWRKESMPEVIWQEKEFVNNQYGGKIDLLCSIRGHMTLVDFKTSKKPMASHFLQLGGYLNLIEQIDKGIYNKIELCQIIAINAKGIKIKTLTKEEMEPYKVAFLKAFELYMIWKSLLEVDWNERFQS
jgi:hypothetical protein